MNTRIKILDISVDTLTKKEAVEKLGALTEKSSPSIIATVNTEFIIKAQADKKFKEILNRKSALNLPDGIGLLWAAKFDSVKARPGFMGRIKTVLLWELSILSIIFWPNYIKKPIKERITGSDFIWDICRFAQENSLRVFLLGGAPTVPERAALELQTKIFGLKIAGVNSDDASNTKFTVEAIKKSRADILLVAYGAPKQEEWLENNLAQTGCKFGMGVGGTFDFLAGTQKRAPRFLQRIGLEWLYRLIRKPRRIWRQLSIVKFIWLVLISKLKSSD